MHFHNVRIACRRCCRWLRAVDESPFLLCLHYFISDQRHGMQCIYLFRLFRIAVVLYVRFLLRERVDLFITLALRISKHTFQTLTFGFDVRCACCIILCVRPFL